MRELSVSEGLFACVFVVILGIMALSFTLFVPPPDRSYVERPESPTWTPEQTVFRQQMAQHNALVDMVRTLRCAYCSEPKFVTEGQLIDHVLEKHGEARANQLTRAFMDQWHRQAGIQ